MRQSTTHFVQSTGGCLQPSTLMSAHIALNEYFKCLHTSLLITILSLTTDYIIRMPSGNNAPEYLTTTIMRLHALDEKQASEFLRFY